MKKAFALAVLLASLGAVGCTSTTPDKKYTADQPPPLAKGERSGAGPTTLEPVKLPPSQVGVRAESIDEGNYLDSVRRLEGGIRADQRALSQAK